MCVSLDMDDGVVHQGESAQRLHGATYVVDLELRRQELDADGLVVDIGLASAALAEVLRELNYRNLDDLDGFNGKNTTSEFLARVVFDRMAEYADRSDVVSLFSARDVSVSSDPPQRIQYDGEIVDATTPFAARVLAGAAHVLVPPGAPVLHPRD